VDGGGNIDTLELDGSGLNLDLTNISNIRIQDIKKIDITGSGDNDLTLNLNDVLDANPDILLNPKRSISISIGITMNINIIGNTAFSLDT
jgi:hypothetical protein